MHAASFPPPPPPPASLTRICARPLLPPLRERASKRTSEQDRGASERDGSLGGCRAPPPPPVPPRAPSPGSPEWPGAGDGGGGRGPRRPGCAPPGRRPRARYLSSGARGGGGAERGGRDEAPGARRKGRGARACTRLGGSQPAPVAGVRGWRGRRRTPWPMGSRRACTCRARVARRRHTHRHTHSHTRRRLGTHTYPGTRTRTHRRSAPRAFTSGLRSPLAPCVSPEAATSKVEVDGMIPPRTVTDDRVNLNGAE